MSLDKAIKHGKERRKGYRERGKAGEYDWTCRPHGSCRYCARNREHRARRQVEAVTRLQDDAA